MSNTGDSVFDEVVSRVAGRGTIIAVSKKQSIDKMLAWEAYASSKNIPIIFGESYVQELREKLSTHKFKEGTRFHLIGPLQSNKVALAVQYADVIESVHSMKILEKVQRQAEKLAKVQDILLQVNISDDQSKGGFQSRELEDLIPTIASYSNLKLKGLMTITRFYSEIENVRKDYQSMFLLAQQVFSEKHILSMGMSNDYSIALEEGATHVRVGTALFGERGAST